MGAGRSCLSMFIAMSLVACGDGGSGGGKVVGGATPTPTPTGSTSACALSKRQDFVLAAMKEWYLFPGLVDTSIDKAAYTSLDKYVDALVAPARNQSRDRYFTYVTSIAEENAYYSQGSTAGFGFRLAWNDQNELVVLESFEGSPALAAGLDRGTAILGVGTSSSTVQNVLTIYYDQGVDALSDLISPDQAGAQRTFRIRDTSGVEREVVLATADFEILPVSPRYGYKIINYGGKKVGYLNLRSFIITANDAMDDAFAEFKAQGVTDLVIDLRYNGGGLISVAGKMASLMGADKSGKLFNHIKFRPEKSENDEDVNFEPNSSSIAPTRIAFITTGSTASASELVINGMMPYLGDNVAMVGANTYGKPVGQIALDLTECDDRLRLVALQSNNRDGRGDYYTGLWNYSPNKCAALDDIDNPLGSESEALLQQALYYISKGTCLGTASARTTASNRASFEMLRPEKPNAAQWDMPGIY